MKTKFKIWATIAWGYRYALRNMLLILRFGWLPMIVACAVLGSVPVLYALNINLETGVEIVKFVGLPTGAYFAVRWHRAILLNEKSPPVLRFGRAEIQYTLFLLPVFFAEYLGAVIRGLGLSVGMTVFMLCLILIVIAILYTAIPMLLPALAIHDRKMSLERAWGLWAGNRLRFFFFQCFSVSIASVLWLLTTKGTGFVNKIIASFLDVDFANLNPWSEDFLIFVGAFNIVTPILAFVLYFLIAATLGALSISYAGISHRAERRFSEYVSPIRMTN